MPDHSEPPIQKTHRLVVRWCCLDWFEQHRHRLPSWAYLPSQTA
ncbi:hypothetical protein [Moraxella catarrhalis]|nr:hypothetical protein [Moraxella catarrhalis]